MVCDQANGKENPFESANILSKLCYWWMASIYYKGVTRDLETEDLYEPVHSERSEVLGDQLEREWNKELMKQKLDQDKRKKKKESQYKPSLLRCAIRIYLWSFSFQTILTLDFFFTIIIIEEIKRHVELYTSAFDDVNYFLMDSEARLK